MKYGITFGQMYDTLENYDKTKASIQEKEHLAEMLMEFETKIIPEHYIELIGSYDEDLSIALTKDEWLKEIDTARRKILRWIENEDFNLTMLARKIEQEKIKEDYKKEQIQIQNKMPMSPVANNK